MNKLILDETLDTPEKLNLEDFNRRKELHESRKLKEDVTEDTKTQMTNSMISTILKMCWDNIDLVNSGIATLQEIESEPTLEVFRNILTDTYTHIGQLEKVIECINEPAINIELGKEEVEDNAIGDTPVEEPEVEEPEEAGEDILPDDDVDESLANSIEFKKKEEAK